MPQGEPSREQLLRDTLSKLADAILATRELLTLDGEHTPQLRQIVAREVNAAYFAHREQVMATLNEMRICSQ